MTALRAIRFAAWGMTAVLGLVVAYLLLTPAPRPGEGGAGRIGGSFQLAQATGGVLDSATLRGKPFGLFFGFTQCPDICPGTLTDMTALMDDLDKGPQAARAKQFRILFVTVDPERDTRPTSWRITSAPSTAASSASCPRRSSWPPSRSSMRPSTKRSPRPPATR